MSSAAVLASVAARKNSCAHVTADQEVSVKTLAEEYFCRRHAGPSIRDWPRRETRMRCSR